MVSTHIEGPVAAERLGKEGGLASIFSMVKTISDDSICTNEELVG